MTITFADAEVFDADQPVRHRRLNPHQTRATCCAGRRWARPKKFKGVKLTDLKDTHTGGPAVAAEWALATTRRRLVAYPEALAAVLHTARALRRSPDTVSVRM